MKNLATIFLLFACVAMASGQTLFTATANRQEVAVGETFTVTFAINANGSNFTYPPFTDFKVVAGPMSSHSTSIINGVSSMEKSVQFQLIALRKGTFTIGQATVKADGKTYKTKPLQIKVVDASQRKPTTAESRAAELASVKIQTNKRKVYVGEPLSARYILVLKTNVGQFEYLSQPEFPGFLKNDIKIDNIKTRQEEINGQRVAVADIQKFVLIPQSAGKFEPGNLELRLPTGVPTGRRDWFGQQEMRTVNQLTKSKFPTIDVLPLPTAGKPASFSGAVGQLKLETKLSRNQVKAGESVTLTVTLRGKGNLQLVEIPQISIPNSIEQYDPKYKEKISILPSGIKGYKSNEYLLIPQYKGTYKIPPLAFSYFDPVIEKYVTANTEELTIEVTEGPEATATDVGNKPQVSGKNQVSNIGEDILFIHTQPSEFTKEKTSFFAKSLHVVLLVLGLIMLAALFVFNKLKLRFKPDLAAKTKRQAGNQAKKKLKKAHAALHENNATQFYTEVANALQIYFAQKANISAANFTQDFVADLLKSKGANDALIQQISHLLNQADMARFAPLSKANMQTDYQTAINCLQNLEQLL